MRAIVEYGVSNVLSFAGRIPVLPTFGLLVIVVVAFFLPLLLALVGIGLGIRGVRDRDSGTPFECGFDPKGSARVPFSLRFFLLAVIFLIFDVEVALLFPLPLIAFSLDQLYPIVVALVFLVILLVGLFHE